MPRLAGWLAGLIPGLTDGGLLMMAGNIVPLDPVSVEIVEDGETGLRVRRVLSCGPVVWLREASTPSVGPVEAV